MNKASQIIIGLSIAGCLVGVLQAQEKIDATSAKSKEAKEKLQNAPAAVEQAIRQNLQDIGKTVSSKLGLGTKEVKTAPAPLTEVASLPEKKPAEAPPVRVPSVGRRDPFRPFTLNVKSAPTKRRDNLSPLERYELGQLKLVGIVADPKNANALVEDASGLGYIVRVGTPIGANDGKVTAIKRDGITIEESYVDLYGAEKRRAVSMKLTAESAE